MKILQKYLLLVFVLDLRKASSARIQKEESVNRKKTSDSIKQLTTSLEHDRSRRTQGVLQVLLGKMLGRRCVTNTPTFAPAPTFNPTASPVESLKECPNKQVRITKVCDVPSQLEDCWFCDYFDIKILLEGDLYWPQETWNDCQWGSWVFGSCEVPMDIDCFDIKNAKAMNFNNPTTDLVLTFIETDGGAEQESFDLVFPSGWYKTDTCDAVRTFEITSSNGIRAEVEVRSSLSACGLEAEIITNGLNDSSVELAETARVLSEYSSLVGNRSNKRIAWPIVGMAARFGARFIGKRLPSSSNVLNALSGLADVTSIASNLKNIFGWGDTSGSDSASNSQLELLEDFRDEVFDRFDQIDDTLNEIQVQLTEGFSSIQQAISDGFAKEELDELITERMTALEDAYTAYLNPNLTPDFVQIYEEAFRENCLTLNPPYSIFKILYQHSCAECNLMGATGPAFQYMLDTFVDKASTLSMSSNDKLVWFRGSYGRVILSAMIKLIYLHSVCLYQPSDLCQKDDRNWSDRLEEMGTALEEVAASITDAENRIN